MATVNSFAVSIGCLVGPFLLAMAPLIHRSRRQLAAEEHDESPFASTLSSDKAPLGFLRGITSSQRFYLLQQLKVSAGTFGALTWGYFVLAGTALLMHLPKGAGLSTESAVASWHAFLKLLSESNMFLLVALALGSFTAISPLRYGQGARFYRSRPLSFGFLFWSGVVPQFAALIGGLIAGLGLALGLVFVLKGAVWQHLPAAMPPSIHPDDVNTVRMYTDVLATSTVRMVLSMLTTAALLSSFILLLLTLPIELKTPGRVPVLLVIFTLAVLVAGAWNVLHILGGAHLPPLPPQLFVYNHLGPPPPYSYALVPIALTAAFLLLSRSFVSRLEV